jgi:hypothetical protein
MIDQLLICQRASLYPRLPVLSVRNRLSAKSEWVRTRLPSHFVEFGGLDVYVDTDESAPKYIFGRGGQHLLLDLCIVG